MKVCSAASAMGSALLFVLSTIGACHETTKVDVPPVTVAAPPTSAASPALAAETPTSTPSGDAGPGADAAAPTLSIADCPIKAEFVDLPAKLEDGLCSRVLVALVKGKATAMKETLAPGDILVVKNNDAMEIQGTGLAVIAREVPGPCAVRDRPAPEKTLVRAGAAPEITWAHGAMHAHLDLSAKVSPQIYMGRLEGTATVAEHIHPGTWEILAAVEAQGTFVLAGTEAHLGPRQIVVVPPDTKHAWKPDPGSKLVAIQMYDPPGPEQRFVALAAADKDAGAPHDAGR